jgi:hypothetical protein
MAACYTLERGLVLCMQHSDCHVLQHVKLTPIITVCACSRGTATLLESTLVELLTKSKALASHIGLLSISGDGPRFFKLPNCQS